MSTIKNTIATTAAAILLFSGSAFAATAYAAPAAGNAPYFDGVVSASQLQRSDVAAEAAANLPAAGQFSAQVEGLSAASGLTRAEVQSSIHQMPAAGEAV